MADNPFLKPATTNAGPNTDSQAGDKQKAEDLQVAGAHAKADVINSPSLDEQANQVKKGPPSGWEKPGSDLQEPTKVEGKVLTQEDVDKAKKGERKPHYIAGRTAPVYWDDKKFDELEQKKKDRLEYFKGDKDAIPEDDEYFKADEEQRSLVRDAVAKE